MLPAFGEQGEMSMASLGGEMQSEQFPSSFPRSEEGAPSGLAGCCVRNVPRAWQGVGTLGPVLGGMILEARGAAPHALQLGLGEQATGIRAKALYNASAGG